MADVFISYRRGKGADLARLMHLRLKERGINAFLDVDDLRAGQFDEALLAEIERASSFLLILSEGALDPCSSEDDWLRREISHALRSKKTIVPLFMSGFEFPPESDLPPELRPIVVHQGVSYSHEFLDAVVDKIVSYLPTRSSTTARARSRSKTGSSHRRSAVSRFEAGQVVKAVVRETSIDIVTLDLPENETGRIFSPHSRLLLFFMPARWLTRSYEVGDRLIVTIERRLTSGNYSCQLHHGAGDEPCTQARPDRHRATGVDQSRFARWALAVADSDVGAVALTALALAVAVGFAVPAVADRNYLAAALASVGAVGVAALFLVNTYYAGWGSARRAIAFLIAAALGAGAGLAIAQLESATGATLGLLVLGSAAALVLLGTYLYYAGS